MKKTWILPGAIVITLGLLVSCTGLPQGAGRQVTLIHMGDVHGHLVPRPHLRSDGNGQMQGGLARMYTRIEEIRRALPELAAGPDREPRAEPHQTHTAAAEGDLGEPGSAAVAGSEVAARGRSSMARPAGPRRAAPSELLRQP